ncbi:hypothetical protein HSX11_08845 [Oxalobacteraceae bacterium]|nr:hypothetical protein [Oxalobacteraceae bacterium]
MKRLISLVLFSLSAHAIAGAADTCTAPDMAGLRSTWQAFRNASLHGTPDQIAKYYKLPVKLLSPMDGDKPFKLDRKPFMAHYPAIFRKDVAGEESELIKNLRRTKDNEYISDVYFNREKCAFVGAIRINDYNFVQDKKAGWLIESVYFGGDYYYLQDMASDK